MLFRVFLLTFPNVCAALYLSAICSQCTALRTRTCTGGLDCLPEIADYMASTQAFFAYLIYIANVVAFHSKAEPHPPPTEVAYEWLDAFTVNLSWKVPNSLSDKSDIKYLVKEAEGLIKTECLMKGQTSSRQNFLTQAMTSDHWKCLVLTVSDCKHSNESTAATINIYPRKPRAELVKDVRCFIYSKTMNCSWIPADQSQNLTVYYRNSGRLEESRSTLKKCNQLYSVDERNGCNFDTNQQDIWILVETEAAMSTFKPPIAIAPPQLTVREEGDHLTLSMKPPIANINHCWTFEVCYKRCNKHKECSTTKPGELKMKIPYDKKCLYELKSKTNALGYCFHETTISEFGQPVTYGINEPPDRTLTVVTIIIPAILSVCVILSCYCFRKHSAAFWPIVPDPSVIFKEMMMNGNKDVKTTTKSLYTPVPEPIECCKITVAPENSVPLT